MHIIATLQNNGIPRFNMDYAQNLFQDENLMIAFYALMFLLAPSSFIFLIPLILRSLLMACHFTDSLLKNSNQPIVYSKISPFLQQVLSKQSWFLQNIALAEVFVGFYLIVACFYMPRALILLIMYWQIMHARYMMNRYIKNAFSTVNKQIESILIKVPFLLNIYRKLTSYLANSVNPDKIKQTMEQGNERRCIIM